MGDGNALVVENEHTDVLDGESALGFFLERIGERAVGLHLGQTQEHLPVFEAQIGRIAEI